MTEQRHKCGIIRHARLRFILLGCMTYLGLCTFVGAHIQQSRPIGETLLMETMFEFFDQRILLFDLLSLFLSAPDLLSHERPFDARLVGGGEAMADENDCWGRGRL